MKNSNYKTKKGGSGGKGMGKTKDSSPLSKKSETNKAPYDVAKAWLKSKKLYDELLSESNKVSFTVDEDGGLDTSSVDSGEGPEDITRNISSLHGADCPRPVVEITAIQ